LFLRSTRTMLNPKMCRNIVLFDQILMNTKVKTSICKLPTPCLRREDSKASDAGQLNTARPKLSFINACICAFWVPKGVLQVPKMRQLLTSYPLPLLKRCGWPHTNKSTSYRRQATQTHVQNLFMLLQRFTTRYFTPKSTTRKATKYDPHFSANLEASLRNRQRDMKTTPQSNPSHTHHTHQPHIHTARCPCRESAGAMERKSAVGGGGSGVGSRAGGVGGARAGEHKMLVEWHPFLPDFFVAGGDELQLYQVHRQRQQHRGFASSGLPQPR